MIQQQRLGILQMLVQKSWLQISVLQNRRANYALSKVGHF
jgi:hypothetical protein